MRQYVTRTTRAPTSKPALFVCSRFIPISFHFQVLMVPLLPFFHPILQLQGNAQDITAPTSARGIDAAVRYPCHSYFEHASRLCCSHFRQLRFHFHALITYRVIFSSLSSLSFHPILRSSVECSGENCACECTGPECGHECTGPNCGPNACCPGRAKNTAGECVAITTTTSTSTSTSTSQNFFGKSGTGSRMRFEPAPDSFITVSSQSLFDLLTPDLISAAVRYRTTLTPPCKPASVCLLALSCHLHYISMHIFSFPSLKHGA